MNTARNSRRAARRSSYGRAAGAAACCFSLLAALSVASHAQPRPDAVQAQQPIHGLNGSWERFGGFGPRAAEGAPRPPAPIPDPPLKPEYLEAWRAERAEVARLTELGLPPANNYSACIPDGMPAMMQAMFPMEVLETPGQVTVIQEAYNQVRRIYLNDELPPAEDAEPRFAGHSAGHWEGDTLVVETVGVKDYVEFRDVPHSPAMRITERISLVGDDYMRNEVTVLDPEYLTEPWRWTWMYRRSPGYKIQEYVCEDNRYYADPELGYQRLRIEDKDDKEAPVQ